jgi:hypothetical protein
MFIELYNGSIVDTDFEEEYGEINNPLGGIGGWYGMFRVYEDRELNVGANMALAFKFWINYWNDNVDYPSITLEEIIKNNKKYNPLYEKYAKDIEKYLMLI